MKWLSKKHVMVDIETLGTTCDSVILSIGACKFDFTSGIDYNDTFYINIDPQSCKDVGMKIDQATVKWWSQQSKEAIAALKTPKPVPVTEAIQGFCDWFKGDFIWCRGMFDVPFLEYAYKVTGVASPYKYWQAMDHRTATTMLDVNFSAQRSGAADHHNALGDAIAQTKTLIELFKKD